MGRYFDDVFLYVDKETALSLKKGSRIIFSGTIEGTDIRLVREGFALEISEVSIKYTN